MLLEELNNVIIRFIEKYPFFVDPIVLFRTDSKYKRSDFLTGYLNFSYPEIDEKLLLLPLIEKELKNIDRNLKETIFDKQAYNKKYANRIEDFHKVIKIIKIFYNENEQEKFNLINDYFWVDIEKVWKILENKDFYLNYFKTDLVLLNENKIINLKNIKIWAEKIKFYFEEALIFLKLDSFWKVKIWDVTSIVHTNFNEKWGEILIPKNRVISIKKLLELIIHEIDWHCSQFSEVEWIYSWSIRFSKSEILLEWYAILLESLFSYKYFWNNRLKSIIEKREVQYLYSQNKISLKTLLENKLVNPFITFRLFKNIKKYSNLKDMVYLQWVAKVIDNLNKYWNFLKIIEKGVINQEYIDKYWLKSDIKEKIILENTSAVYILNKYFIL